MHHKAKMIQGRPSGRRHNTDPMDVLIGQRRNTAPMKPYILVGQRRNTAPTKLPRLSDGQCRNTAPTEVYTSTWRQRNATKVYFFCFVLFLFFFSFPSLFFFLFSLFSFALFFFGPPLLLWLRQGPGEHPQQDGPSPMGINVVATRRRRT